MARYTGEARITFIGDRALAARYVSEGRKYLGGLMITSPVQTAVRELTNPDGVQFRVGYFGGVPFIEITAGATQAPKYSVLFVGGYLMAPRTTLSLTGYSANPFVLINPKPGNESAWSSYYAAVPPPPLTLSTHPTSSFIDPVKTVKDVVQMLSVSAATALPNIHNAGMTWNNADETLWLTWSGAAYVQKDFNGYTSLYHNAKLIANLYVSGDTMLLGAGARRTETGIDVIAVVAIADGWTGPFRLSVRLLKFKPVDSEAARLKEYQGVLEKAFSYAALMQPDVAAVELLSYPLSPKIDRYGWGSIAFNQACTEARGFVYLYNGINTVIKEIVVDLSDLDAVEINDGSISTTVTVQSGSKTLYSAMARDMRFQLKTSIVGTPGLPADPAMGIGSNWPSGVYPDGPYVLADTDTVYGLRFSNTAFSNPTPTISGSPAVFVPEWSSYESLDEVSPTVVKALCDYIDGVPVYGYVHLAHSTQLTTWSQPDYTLTHDISRTSTGSIVGSGTAWAGTGQWVQFVWNGSSENTAVMSKNSVGAGLLIPNYDINGDEDGFWLDVKGTTVAESSASTVVEFDRTNEDTTGPTTHTWDGNYSSVTLNSASETRIQCKIRRLNLRTKTAAFGLEKYEASSSATDTKTAPAVSQNMFTGTRVTTSANNELYQTKEVVIANGVAVLNSAYANQYTPTNTTGGSTTAFSVNNTGSGEAPLNVATPFYKYTGLATTPATEATALNPAYGWTTAAAYEREADYGWTHTTLIAIKATDVDNMDPEGLYYTLPDMHYGAPYLAVRPNDCANVVARSDSYIVNYAYPTGTGNAAALFTAASNAAIGAKGTLDYMTGAHAAPWFTSPFLISAIAVKALKQ